VVEAYGAEKFARLTALKRRYDPDNFFHVNQNIPPARSLLVHLERRPITCSAHLL
jgi:hypothetical protein